MNRSFAPHLVRPNLPLRKPSSSPVAVATATPPLRAFTRPGATPLSPLPRGIGEGSVRPLVVRDKSAVLGSMPQAQIVFPCNFCGQQGHLRCSCCKKTTYCSSACQSKDWLAHRHVCKATDPEPAKEKPKEPTVSPGPGGDRAGQLETKHAADTPRVYFKDLDMNKINLGTDIQASVVELYSPGRFFLLAQSPEMLETLRGISTELQKTYSCSTATTYAPCFGEVCGVQFSSDLNWYRGLVQTLAADQKTANVLYIDFGNEEHVPVERMRPLAANIQRSCPCALECRIAGVVPLDGSWTAECCIAVKQLLAGQTVTARPIEMVENGRIHVVDVQLPTGKQLKTFLLEHGYATKETVVVPPPTRQEISAMMSASLENFKRRSSGKDDNSWARPPEPLTQAVGDAFTVVVTHFQSPTDMIVQKVENAGVIQELQVKLREHCSRVPAPPNFRPAPGTVCCAQFSDDKQWYRAKVLAYPSEERVCVGYVDFGNSEEVDLGHLRPITTSLLALPMQALPCGLAGVQPVGERWSDDCLMALQRRVSNRILRVEIQGAHEGKVLVAMIDEGSDPQANIAELLISANYAAPAPHPIVGEQQVDQTAVPAAEPQVPSVPTPATEPMVWSFAEIPSDGQVVALQASVVENPGEFYCHIDNPTDHQRLNELRAELKQHCEADNSPFEPKVGEPCCAMYPGDGAWYRAMVKELCENLVSVNIADYGFTMKVEKHQLRSITPQLLTLPFQAVGCWLSGVEPLGSEWSSEAQLWFQTLVDGVQLFARVRSVTEQGYGVELESRGRNVAAALISEQLAKVPGQITTETHAAASPVAAPRKSTKEKGQNQTDPPDLSQSKASAKKPPSECQTTAPSEVPSFPVDWKTVELPVGETFKPLIVALTSPRLFYVLGSTQDQQKVQELMMEVAAYCTNNQACLSSTVHLSRPVPGAACCAQFSDNNWYRAVVLEVGDNDVSVVYADYCNTERVPFSRILPIPKHLLQLPFQISRCTLTGKEHFPTEWPEDVQHMFQTVLMGGVLATVQSSDGSANVLSLALPAESGGGDLTAMIVDALQVQAKSKSSPAALQKADQTDRGTPAASTTAAPDVPQPQSTPEAQKGQGQGQGQGHAAAPASTTISPEPKSWTPQQSKNISAQSVTGDPVQKIIAQMEPPCTVNAETKDPQTSGCCCLSLKAKIDHLEKLMQQQLSLIELLVTQAR